MQIKRIVQLLLLLSLLLLTACQTTNQWTPPPPMPLQKLSPLKLEASLPDKPAISQAQVNGAEVAVLDLNNTRKLTDYVRQSKANTENLNMLVTAHNQTIGQYNTVVDVALKQEVRANENYALYLKEQQEHERDKTWFAIEKVFWQAIAIIGLAL